MYIPGREGRQASKVLVATNRSRFLVQGGWCAFRRTFCRAMSVQSLHPTAKPPCSLKLHDPMPLNQATKV